MEENDRLLLAFDPDPVRARKKIEDLRFLLVKYFRWRHGGPAEDLAQETLARGFARILKGVAINPDPVHYFYGIARHVSQEQTRSSAKDSHMIGLEEMMFVEPIEFKDPTTTILLKECLRQMPPDEATLLVKYHVGNRARLAADRGVSVETLRVQAFRAARKLIACIGRRRRGV